MTESCGNCGQKITEPGVFSGGNLRYAPEVVQTVNATNRTNHPDLCRKCGKKEVDEARRVLKLEISLQQEHASEHMTAFPMVTLHSLPGNSRWWIKGLVTANVTVGTGVLNEIQQARSDFYGRTDTEIGMAGKVNSGEATARRIVLRKAMELGANCVLGIDLDYGVTLNNAATVNMQGTAVLVEDLSEILAPAEHQAAEQLLGAGVNMATLRARLNILGGPEI